MNPHEEPSYPGPSPVPARGFQLDTKALTVAGVAMGVTLTLWLLQQGLTSMAGGAGSMIMLLLLAGGGGYAYFRGRNPAQAHSLEARVQQFTQNAAGRMSAAGAVVTAPAQPTAPTSWNPSPAPQFRTIGTTTASPGTDGLVSAALLLPSVIAYAWRYGSTGFSDPWQPWWILTSLHLYFVVCVAVRARTAGRRPLAILLGLVGTALIGLANNPSDDVNLMMMFSTKRYSYGVAYHAPPSPEVMMWIYRAPLLATLIFVAAWGIARRRSSGWVLGLIPAGLLVWWSIYGAEHSYAWQGSWFRPWMLSVGAFVGGCVCCWLAELLTSTGRPNIGVASYPSPGGQPGTHADYRDQAARHFPGPEQTYGPPGGQGGFG
ncbi:hypothetical protein KIH27_20135 [Mycobacterium sp. M1]|uniref:Integral membrane protein n=1 Tax=Mycolicibacter acidiphilus TaxID=2835306 RepID=A0ABS5RNM5_9MYCO|nr:hypothetical protein [Mycolicibacter acidiphilus]MBS9535897.1 hypothetical protein [Mycolicibacter acidiphilus]